MDAFLSTFKNSNHAFVSFRNVLDYFNPNSYELAIDWAALEVNPDIRFYNAKSFEECRLAYIADIGYAIEDENDNNAQMQEDAENSYQNEIDNLE